MKKNNKIAMKEKDKTPMKNSQQESSKRLINFGLILILVSLVMLFITGKNRHIDTNFFDDSGGFFFNYFLSGFYFLCVLISNRPFFRFKQIDRKLMVIVLILFSISSFTLNNSLVIFSEFTRWTVVYLLLFYTAFLGTVFLERIPQILRYFVFFFLGTGLVITTYFIISLAPLYHIAIIGLILFGMSIHLVIPVFVTISVIWTFIKLQKTRVEKVLFFAGIIVPLLITTIFLYQWNTFKTEIHKATSSIVTRPYNTLPEWVLLCQDMPTDLFSQKIIKGKLSYDVFEDQWRGWNNSSFDEVKKHDPLVNMGMFFFGDINLDQNTRVKILKSQFNARHLAQRKLWSGRNLGTIEVLNTIQVFPDYRLAYAEKIITVKNFNSWQRNQQEAAFTFYLPEGSVATSLSLWIDGKEEKSRLTTKSKADSAYVSIVGVERRDPALLHWQEGNTLTVTVFPCTPAENRRFKIGITTPLQNTNDVLTLQNVYFDGPVTHDILETSKVEFVSENQLQNIRLPNGFKKGLENDYTYDGQFRPYWEVSCSATPLSKRQFFFNEHSYSVEEMKKESTDFNPDKVYLDINKSWSRQEFESIIALLSGKDIYAHHDRFVKIQNENQAEIFELLTKKNFSLLPFNKIADWDNALVISKSTELSPNLSDLEDSTFLNQLVQKINSSEKKINLFQLGETTSPYLKSLKEFQVLNFHAGDFDELSSIIKNTYFYKYNDNPSVVNLDIANMSIVKGTTQQTSKAPDHLLRLFAYNTLMKQMGPDYFEKDKGDIDPLIAIANEAYIVSPISSLIVLETQKDYDRFDIPENENSLKNASVKSSGAVPEPEEWLLIFLFVSILTFLFLKKRKISLTKWK